MAPVPSKDRSCARLAGLLVEWGSGHTSLQKGLRRRMVMTCRGLQELDSTRRILCTTDPLPESSEGPHFLQDLINMIQMQPKIQPLLTSAVEV